MSGQAHDYVRGSTRIELGMKTAGHEKQNTSHWSKPAGGISVYEISHEADAVQTAPKQQQTVAVTSIHSMSHMTKGIFGNIAQPIPEV